MRKFYKIFFFICFLIGNDDTFSQSIQPDLPNPGSNPQTATQGSLVIPMDNVNQDNGGLFNLKSYGLVHALLMNDIPVKWVISAGKVKDAIDFSAAAERLYPSFVASATLNFIASAFIIDSIWVNTPSPITGQTATQVITSFGNNVAVFRLMQNITVDVRYTLNFRPKIAVFNNGGNQAIHVAILNAGGVTNYYVINAGVFPGITQCYTFCSEPHWAGAASDSNITNNIKNYVLSGGNFLAQCHGVQTYENLSFFHTDSGISEIGVSVTNNYYNNDLAYMQFHGAMRANEGGSGKNWIRAPASSWIPGFYYCISHNNIDTVIAMAAHLTHPDSAGGNTYYLGGHDYSPFTALLDINSARLYLNASLVPSGRPVPFTVNAGANNTICLGSSVTLGGSPTAPAGVTYLWSPASSLNNSTSANPVATPTVTTIYAVNADNGGCTSNGTVTVTVVPPSAAPTATSNSPVCIGGTLSLSASAIAGATYSWSGPNGFTSTLQNPTIGSVTTANAGTYTVTASVNGCLSPSAVTTVIIGPSPGITASQTNVSCFGGSNGTAAASASGGTAPYTYLWSNGQTTSSATGLLAGTYTVNVTEANGCVNTATVSITEPAVLTSTVSSTNVFCFGGNNGSAAVFPSGGTPSYSYLWSNGQTTSSATGLFAGNYSVTTTDANGCTATSTVAITEPATGLSSTTTQTNVSCFGGSDGTASISPSGGTPPYTYLWNPTGQTTSSVTGLSAGSYTATATDANGCAIQVITITQPPAPLSSTASQTNICSGASNGSTTVSASGGTPSYSYLWSNGQTTSSATGLPAGNYSVTVTDANGCTTVSTGTVTLFPAVSSAASQNNVSCFGGSNGTATVTVTGGTPAFTYQWNNGQTTSSATGLIAGNYSVAITDANGCTASASISITQPTVLTSISFQTNVSCFGGSNGTATAAAAGGTPSYTYLWSNGQTTSSATNLSAGNYSVIITDTNGCTTTNTVAITQPAAPLSFSSSQNNVSCFGGSNGTAWVSASGGTSAYTYLWSNGATDENIINLMAGTYTTLITDMNGCTLVSSIVITEPAVLSSTASQTNICSGASNGWVTATATGGTPSYSYLWSNGQTISSATGLPAGNYSVVVTDANGCTSLATGVVYLFPAVAASSSQTSVSCFGGNNGSATVNASGGNPPFTYVWSSGQTTSASTGLTAGNYTVTITDANGCTAVDTISVSEPPAIAANHSSTNSSSCVGNGTATVNASGGTPSYTYLWDNGQTTTTATGLSPGNYSVTITDANGCTFVDTVNVNGFGAPLANAGPDVSICLNNSTTLTASGGISYSWSNGGTSSSVSVAPTVTTSYTVIAADANGCTASDTVTVTVNLPPVVSLNFNGDSGCAPLAVTFTGISDTAFTYLWNFGDNSSANGNPVVHNYITAGTYTASLTVIGTNGCLTVVTTPAPVEVYPNPTAYFTTSPAVTPIPKENPAISFTNQSSGAISYVWDFGDGSTSALANPQHHYAAIGFYTVTLITTNQYGCKDTFRIQTTGEGDITFPTAFSPNGDNLNDVFFPFAWGVEEFNMMIFNRWGELIFETVDIKIGWDGYYLGKLCQQDVYVWKAYAKFIDGRILTKAGDVTLLR